MDLLPGIISAAIGLSATYALIALAWVIIYRTSYVLNFATGQMLVLGAFVYFQFAQPFGLPTWASVALALLLTIVTSVAIFRLLVARLVGQPAFAPIILMFGVAILIDRFVAITWGTAPRVLDPPFPNEVFRLPFGIVVTSFGVATLLAAAAVFAPTVVFLRRTRAGIAMTAVAENPVLAGLSGIDVRWTAGLAWAIAAVAATMAGVTYSYAGLLSPASVHLGLRGIAPAFVGGLDSVSGVVAGAVLVGVFETVAVVLLGGQARDAAAWFAIFVVLLVRPQGLFGAEEIRRV